MTEQPQVDLSDPAEVATLLPYLVGFEPRDCLLLVNVRAGVINEVGAMDLDPGYDFAEAADAMQAAGVTELLLAGYGEEELVTGLLLAGAAAARTVDIHLLDAILIGDGRLTSLGGGEPGRIVFFDPAATAVGAVLAAEGRALGPEDPELLTAAIAPPSGAEGRAMAEALATAHERMTTRLRDTVADLNGIDDAARASFIGVLQREIVADHEAGRPFPVGRAAMLLHVLAQDVALCRHGVANTEGTAAQLGAWTELIRHADEDHKTVAAALLIASALQGVNRKLAIFANSHARKLGPRHPVINELMKMDFHGLSSADIRKRLHG